MTEMRLPIHDVLDEFALKFARANNIIIAAPPGAGKTTVIPLEILTRKLCLGADGKPGRIILVEPRRLAARSAAKRMADSLGETVGQTVGYRMRLDTKITNQTKIEVVTEGVFTRMVLDDPELEHIACVIFDEFHERALDADFGLALALDVQSALRDDLKIIVMSATLDVEQISTILPVAETLVSEGRTFPIDLRYQPRPPRSRIEDVMVGAIKQMHQDEAGSLLCFLPGQGEITRVFDRISGQLGPDTDIYMLYGALSVADQESAVRPPETGKRKVVLATSIAETSITIDGVRIIIDSGLQRQALFEPGIGITRLETMRAPQASTIQRAGRAGRTEPGIALRLWQEEQQKALPKYATPQILNEDLSSLILDCLSWGVKDLSELSFITQPPKSAIDAAFAQLVAIGAVDDAHLISTLGKAIRALPLPVKLAAMVLQAGQSSQAFDAAKLAILLTEKGLGGSSIDLEKRYRQFEKDQSKRAKSARNLAKNIANSADKLSGNKSAEHRSLSEILMLGFPDRIAKQRDNAGQYTMANGRGAVLETSEDLAKNRFLVVADLTGKAAAPRVLSAIALDVQELPAKLIIEVSECQFDKKNQSVKARLVQKIGAIKLSEKALAKPDGDEVAACLSAGVKQLGLAKLPFSKTLLKWRDRSEFYRLHLDENWPDLSDDGLINNMHEWFEPYQTGITSVAEINAGKLTDGVKNLLTWDQSVELDKLVPEQFSFPDKTTLPIVYRKNDAILSIQVKKLYGQTTHPSILSQKFPLLLELLSPANRPIQLTRDLPGFWQGSWKDVRADMRSRYPKHDWPEDPVNAKPPLPRNLSRDRN